MNSYYEEAYEFINTFHPLPESVFKKLYDSAIFKKLKSNEKLLKQGVVPQKLYFIAKGVIRAYLVLDTGKELTTTLLHPLMFFASYKALLKKQPTNIIYEALTDCDVFEIDFADFIEATKENTDLIILYSKILEYIILRSEARFIELSHKDAKERYLALRERIPNLDNIIPQYQIAASIGITPVQLSRIRAKLN